MNDSVQIDINYLKNIDLASFNFILMYNYDIVGTKSFFYN